ncbi:MAG TPA: hypothetical protein VFJ72_03085 [Rubrobacteraceae bacterium]|nr:hypothetical protein [Rubrobacteraceae bacterium]
MKVRLPAAVWKPCLALLQTAIILQAAGCQPTELVASAVETHVKADGGAERRVILDASPPGPKLSLAPAWSIREGLDPKGRSVSRGATFEDLAGPGRAGMRLDVKDRFLWREYAFSDRPGGLLEAGRELSGKTGYKLVMPGRITESPGASQRTGAVALYRFERDERVEVKAKSWAVRWWAVAVTAAGVAVAGALVFGGRAGAVARGFGRWLWTGQVRREGQG